MRAGCGRHTVGHHLLVLLPWLVLSEPALSEVLVKGLTEGSAILLIDGRLTILREGESRRGVTLLRADNEAAVLELDGRRVSLPLDTAIAERYEPPQHDRAARAGTDVLYRHKGSVTEGATSLLSVKLVDERDDRVALGVEYVYAGDYGQEVYLAARAHRDGEDTGNAQAEPAKLLKGKHYVEIVVASAPAAPLVHVSDALRLAVYWNQDGVTQGEILSRVIPLNKYWKKVRVR